MKVICLICNLSFARIGNHLPKHKITLDAYLRQFPGAETCAYRHSEDTLSKMRGDRPRAKGIPKSVSHREKLSQAKKGKKTKPHSAETLQRMREAWVRRKANEVTYAKYIENLSKRHSTPEYLSILRDRISVMIKMGNHNGKSSNTKLELKLKKYLESLHIDYEQQFILQTKKGSWTFDFYLPQFNMLVETDSEYYHTLNLEVWNRDCLKERIAIDRGFQVARISDKAWTPEVIFSSSSEIRSQSDKLKARHHAKIMSKVTN